MEGARAARPRACARRATAPAPAQEKHERVTSAAPDYMARLIRLHQQARALGGNWPPEPPQFADWTSELWAITSPEVNPLAEPMAKWYTRCACRAADGGTDNSALVDASGRACSHFVHGSDVIAKLKRVTMANNETLYKTVKGRSRSDAPVYDALRRTMVEGMSLHSNEKSAGGQRNIIFGIVLRNPTPHERCAAAQFPSQFADE